MPNVGPLEIAVVLVIVLVVFGPKRLPELGKSLGKGIREFKGSLSIDDKQESPAGQDHQEVAAGTAAVSGQVSSEPLHGTVVTDASEPLHGTVVTDDEA
jgi:sec-independent protein translocase protein TatA